MSGLLVKAKVSAWALGAVINPKSNDVRVIETSDGLMCFFMALFILLLKLLGNRYWYKKILSAIC